MSWWNTLQFDVEFYEGVLRLLQGKRVDPLTQKISPLQTGIAMEGFPWIFIKSGYQPNCDIWNHEYWQKLKLLPEFCRLHCHKIVVKPTTIYELHTLYGIMQALDFPSKLGMDKRDYTFGPYAAFFYCTSMKEGLGKYQDLKKILEDKLPSIFNRHPRQGEAIILKKGCTEMEHRRFSGKRSDEWGFPSASEEQREMLYNDIVKSIEDKTVQPDWVKNAIYFTWLATAHAIGDVTYYDVIKEIGVPDLFGDPPVTYHHLSEISTEGGDAPSQQKQVDNGAGSALVDSPKSTKTRNRSKKAQSKGKRR